MPYIDDTTPGLNTQISDWVLGDAREFDRVNTDTLDQGDSITDAYLTIKSNPTSIDADAICQVHVTLVLGNNGGIVGNNITIIVYGTQIATAVAGQVYYYDIVVVTTLGARFTIENGQITFQQGVTQAQSGNSPAVFPDAGIPNFKGFASGPPTGNYNFGIYNQGDFWMNSLPAVGQPLGWSCIAAGSPGTWRAWPNLS